MFSKSKVFSKSYNDVIIIVTSKEVSSSNLGEKYLGVEQVYSYTPESAYGIRRARNDNYETEVYGNLEYLGEKKGLHFYNFYYFYDGEKITTLYGKINLFYYLIIKYNIRDCVLMDKNTKVRLKDTDYFVSVNTNYSINKDGYKQVSRKYSYSIMENEKSKDKIISLNDFKTNIVESLKPKNLNELIRRQCNYVEEKYLDANISLSSIPTDKEICDYISDCFIVDRDIFEDMSESLERGTYSLEDLVEDIKSDNLTCADNIPKYILIKILETYPDTIKMFDKETLSKEIIYKYAKGKLSWLDIPFDDLDENDLLYVLIDMNNRYKTVMSDGDSDIDKEHLFDDFYYYYIIDSLNKVDKDTKNKCLSILDNASFYDRKTKIAIYRKAEEIDRIVYLLERLNDVSINDLKFLPKDKFSTEFLVSLLSKTYDKSQDGDTFYLIVYELWKTMSPEELDSYISDSLIVGKIYLQPCLRVFTNHIGWLTNSIMYQHSVKILSMLTEENIESFADSLFSKILERAAKYKSEPLLWFLTSVEYNYRFIDYLSSNNKKLLRECLLNNINKENSILEHLGHKVVDIVKSLDFSKEDYVTYYLDAMSSNHNAYLNYVMPEELLEELKSTSALPHPSKCQ